jgi:hypothetical protein
MDLLTGLIASWGLVTAALIVLYIYRSRLESKEADWIPLTDDAREDKAIKEQTLVEKRAEKFDWPIRALGLLSVVLLLLVLGYFVYSGITTPRPQSE